MLIRGFVGSQGRGQLASREDSKCRSFGSTWSICSSWKQEWLWVAQIEYKVRTDEDSRQWEVLRGLKLGRTFTQMKTAL